MFEGVEGIEWAESPWDCPLPNEQRAIRSSAAEVPWYEACTGDETE